MKRKQLSGPEKVPVLSRNRALIFFIHVLIWSSLLVNYVMQESNSVLLVFIVVFSIMYIAIMIITVRLLSLIVVIIYLLIIMST